MGEAWDGQGEVRGGERLAGARVGVRAAGILAGVTEKLQSRRPCLELLHLHLTRSSSNS